VQNKYHDLQHFVLCDGVSYAYFSEGAQYIHIQAMWLYQIFTRDIPKYEFSNYKMPIRIFMKFDMRVMPVVTNEDSQFLTFYTQ
jgi:hypothetical protein